MPKLRGTLLDDAGAPAEGSVILFPEDEARWSEGSRLIRSARPDPSGAFEFRNVVPGDYLLAPVHYVRETSGRTRRFFKGCETVRSEYVSRIAVQSRYRSC